ncbi:MAG: oxidoreductase, partial [Thermoleophilia bacterium]|nr:oxidoreductase [Thermoleophilia bacterium]
LCSSAVDPAHPAFSIKASGDFTRTVHALPIGTQVLLDGPHGAWEPPLADAGFILIVAGIGVTPAMSVLRTMADIGDTREVQLIYGARQWDDVTFREELDHLGGRINLEIAMVISKPDGQWEGLTGRIDQALLARVLPADARERNLLICGPPAMIDAAMTALHELGIPSAHVRAERFDSV